MTYINEKFPWLKDYVFVFPFAVVLTLCVTCTKRKKQEAPGVRKTTSVELREHLRPADLCTVIFNSCKHLREAEFVKVLETFNIPLNPILIIKAPTLGA